MLIDELMEKKEMTKYRLAKESGVPYATVSDICGGKARLERCAAETVYRISKALGVPMESLVEPYIEKRVDFELFKSETCHRLKRLGDIEFLIALLEKDEIQSYYKKRWYPEALYLLAMLDYISKENGVPLCDRYESMRSAKLKDILYPAGVLAIASAMGNDDAKRQALEEAIPEFLRFNIIESEVRNVV